MASDPSGWMSGVEQVRTREYGYPDVPEDGMYPQAVVSHVMQGYQRTMIQWARDGNAGKSAHFTVGRDGRIVQHVSIWDPAWHAGDVNAPTTPLATRYPTNPNRWTVGIEQEGFSIDPGYGYDYLYSAAQPWPEPLIRSVIAIHQFVFGAGQWLIDAPDKAERVVTHSMLNSRSRAQDPGDLWLATVRPRIVDALAAPVPAPAPDLRQELLDAKNAGFEAGRVYGWNAHAEAVDRQLAGLRQPQ